MSGEIWINSFLEYTVCSPLSHLIKFIMMVQFLLRFETFWPQGASNSCCSPPGIRGAVWATGIDLNFKTIRAILFSNMPRVSVLVEALWYYNNWHTEVVGESRWHMESACIAHLRCVSWHYTPCYHQLTIFRLSQHKIQQTHKCVWLWLAVCDNRLLIKWFLRQWLLRCM